jgi:CDP-diacylglycerol--serine O-phosphatidyltransferase
MNLSPDRLARQREAYREHRRRRFRRRSRRAYIRWVYALPSLATLGNAICGFAAIYVATLDPTLPAPSRDRITQALAGMHLQAAVYLIFVAMIFDALDGRLARLTRHTTDFGGQLDSLCDVISFGCAPAFLALQLFRQTIPSAPVFCTRLIWAIGALYMSCAAIRLARFNVSNEHGEQHHFSFLGLPSPGAAAVVAGVVLLQRKFITEGWDTLAYGLTWLVPLVVLAAGLLMVSHIRYPHLINRYLRGRRSPAALVLMVAIVLGVSVAHWYVIAAGTLIYAALGPVGMLSARWRRSTTPPAPGSVDAN